MIKQTNEIQDGESAICPRQNRRHGGIKIWMILLLLCAVSVAAGTYVGIDYYNGLPEDINPTFVGRQSCIECHQEQANLFHGSHHDLAMDIATDDTVLAKFDGSTIEHYGITSRMFRDGDRFMINTEGPDGEMADFEVKYVFGYEPLQQYMVELERPENAKPNEIGRVQVLRVSWDTEKNEWFYLPPPDVDEKLDTDDPLHWTGITQNWNASCADCHSTNLQKNFDHQKLEYRTTFSEIDVSCESCHGPGSAHVSAASDLSLFWDRRHGMALPKLKSEDTRPQIETCAKCHSRRRTLCNGFQPGDMYHNNFSHELLREQSYFDDGQIKDEVYVYGSFLQSKMYHQNIRCSDCHDPHSTRLKFEGNQVCTSCHQHPAGKYDSPSHHHHEIGSTGSLCVECHMPHTYYMKVDPRRDHSIRVPRPDMSVKHQTPNACTQCHINTNQLDQQTARKLNHYQDWLTARDQGNAGVENELQRIDQAMAEAVKQWYPESAFYDGSNGDFVTKLVEARNSTDNRIELLSAIVKNRAFPEIIRASAMSDMRDDSSEMSLESAEVAVKSKQQSLIIAGLYRIESEISSRVDLANYFVPRPGMTQQQVANQFAGMFNPLARLIEGQLENELRSVRVAAARVYASIPRQIIGNELPDSFAKAKQELIESLLIDNDRGTSHRALGSVYEMLGDSQKAKGAYQDALRVAPNLIGVRSNLAALLENEKGILEQQVQSMQQSGLAKQADAAQRKIENIDHQVQDLRAREHELLKRDLDRAEGLPNADGLHFRYAMSCYIQDDLANAEKHLLKAYEINSEVPSYMVALASYYQKKGDRQRAFHFARKLVELQPDHPGYQNLLRSIEVQ